MNTADKLEMLLEKARNDEVLKQNLLDTRNEADPLAAFCKVAAGAGVELTVMDIVNQGEEFYAEINAAPTVAERIHPILISRMMSILYS